MTATTLDPRPVLLAAPMSRFQKAAVGVVVCLCMLDGFNVFAGTFAAPAIKAAWHVNQAQLGLVLSSGLLGMAAGSLIIAPAADLTGRRRMVFLSLTIMMFGGLTTAFMNNVQALMLSWAFTGLGVGAMIPVIASLAAEYASSRSRDFCLTIMGMGFPLGGLLGGLSAAYLLPHYGWRAIFLVAASLSLVLLAVAAVMLPEPVASLMARPKRDVLVRVNAYLARCGLPSVTALPAPPEIAKASALRALFAPGQASATLIVASIYFLHVITLFFVQSWLPSLVASEGFTPAQAALVGIWVNVGGIVGGPLLGANSMRLGLKPLVMGAILCGAAVTAAFGFMPPNFALLSLVATGMGLFLQGGMIGLYAVTARTFPAHMRASGTGLVMGVGRIGSAIGPALAGQLMTMGVSRGSVAAVMAVPALAAALMLLNFRLRPPNLP